MRSIRARRSAARRSVWLEAGLMALATLALLSALIAPLLLTASPLTPDEKHLWDAYRSGELIRLHILADSDAPRDQQVKLLVRNALLEAFGERLYQAGEADAATVYAALQADVEGMRAVAARCARENGFDGDITAEVGVMRLPAKRYGRVTLPEGEYRALRVTLGSGEGRNWWCVLFPRMCLAIAGEDATATPEAPIALRWSSWEILDKWLIWGSDPEGAAEPPRNI